MERLSPCACVYGNAVFPTPAFVSEERDAFTSGRGLRFPRNMDENAATLRYVEGNAVLPTYTPLDEKRDSFTLA